MRKSPAPSVPAEPEAPTHAGQPPARAGDGGERLLGGGAGDAEVPEVVPELLELVEDHRLRLGLLDLPAGVEDLLDVGLAPRRRDDLGADRGEPLEPLAAHLLGEDRHRVAAQQRRVERAAAAVVAGRGPHRLLRDRVELPRDQAGHEAAERRADLVRAGREVAPDEADDAGRHAGQLGRDHERVHRAEAAGRRVVVPGDAEEVEGVHGLHVDPGQASRRSQGRWSGDPAARRWSGSRCRAPGSAPPRARANVVSFRRSRLSLPARIVSFLPRIGAASLNLNNGITGALRVTDPVLGSFLLGDP